VLAESRPGPRPHRQESADSESQFSLVVSIYERTLRSRRFFARQCRRHADDSTANDHWLLRSHQRRGSNRAGTFSVSARQSQA